MTALVIAPVTLNELNAHKDGDSYEIKIGVHQLKHNLVESLGEFYVVFDSYEGTSSFAIDYEIMAANLPKPTTGQLHVIVRKA